MLRESVWHAVWTEEKVLMAERLFYWDDTKSECGVVLLPPGSEIHFSRLRQLAAKLVKDSVLRKKHQRDLIFPLSRHYSTYGAFPEEK
jgi:hypothetical protein